MKHLRLLIVAFFYLVHLEGLNAQSTPRIVIQGGEDKLPMSDQDLKNDPNAFQIAIVTDRTGGHRDGIFPDAIRKLNLLQPEFVMSVGDLIEGYTEDESIINSEWDEMDGFIEELNMPFFYLPGNHDYTNKVMAKVWDQRLGPSYYNFVYKDVLFTCLNSMDPNATIGEEQINWVKKVIEENHGRRWHLIFVHHPLWNGLDEVSWNRLEKIFKTGPDYTVFAGHHHRYFKQIRDDQKHITLATTGGGSKLRGPAFGEFDHVVWLTMNEDGPLIANLLLEGIWDENVVTEEKRLFNYMISNPNNLKVPPILFEDELKQGKIKVRIANDFDVPLKMNFEFVKKSVFSLDKEFPENVTIDPNSVEVLEYQANFDQEQKNDASIATVKWKATVTDPDGLEVELNSDMDIRIIKLLPGPQESIKKKLDGTLKDWREDFILVDEPKQIVGKASSWNGASDGSYKFAMSYDKKYVYLAIQVFDDQVISHKDKKPWEQDGIEVRLDARQRSVSAISRGRNEGNDVLLLAISPNHNTNEEPWLTHQKKKLPEGTRYVCVQNKAGYIAELAIPLTYFEEKQGSEWKDFRLNICVDDTDTDGFTQLWWRPSWRDKENVVGSGIFLKR